MIITPLTPELVRGAARLERTPRGLRPDRLPSGVARQTGDGQLAAMAAQPSGVRLALSTVATTIELVSRPTHVTFRGVDRPRGAIDLVIGGELVASDPLTGGTSVVTDLGTGEVTTTEGPDHLTRFTDLPPGEKHVELWLPHNEGLDLVELRTDAPVGPARSAGRRWVHHGSSISQGSNATSPARTWPSLVAREGGMELQNLGVGGAAMVDPLMARVIRDSPADVISLAFGINVVNADAMRLRSFVPAVHGFLDTVRDGHPATPLLLATPLFCPIHEDTPGPLTIDPEALGEGRLRYAATGDPQDVPAGRLTLRVIREALAAVVEERDDPHLRLIDGLSLYGEGDAAELPLEDGLHPDTATHALIAERVLAQVAAPASP